MSFASQLDISGELCDKCLKPMTEQRPGLQIHTNSRETGRQHVWIHIDELSRAMIEAKKELIPKPIENPAAAESKGEVSA